MTPPALIDRCLALLEYDTVSRQLVTALKMRNNRAALPWMSLGLANLLCHAKVDQPNAIVTWAPTARVRARTRGFDHARLLANATARTMGLPARQLLHRVDATVQTGRSRSERLQGATMRAKRPISGRVILIDDVMTTGATLSSAAAELRRAGATEIIAAVIAHRVFEDR